MNEPTLEAVLQRLNRLERQMRWWKGAGLTIAALIGLVIMGAAKGAGVAEEIKAKRFVLVKENGKAGAVMDVSPSGGIGLVMLDKAGASRISMHVGPDGSPALGLVGEHEKYFIGLLTRV